MTDKVNDTQDTQEPDYEAAAREMGWSDKDSFNGPEDKWVDAKTFVERGEHIMPILRANNKRLKEDLLTRDREVATLKQSVEAANKAIKALQKHYTEATAAAVEQARKDLKEQLRQAREIGDIDAEEEIRDKMADLRTSKVNAEDKAGDTPPVENKEPQLSPEFISWKEENPWFSDTSTAKSRKRIADFVFIGEQLREDGDTSVGKAFMDKCLKILNEQNGEGKSASRQVSKVESGSNGTRATSGGRAFDKLPKEAKDICHSDNDSFVGPGKMFKTVREWEDHYANLYGED